MFGAPMRHAGAGARYRDVDVAARVQGASPHELITILFDELLKGLDTLRAAERAGMPRPPAVQSRALSILHGLEAGLDFERGGEIAASLARIYREARRLLATTGAARMPALDEARAMLADIAGAWSGIG